MGAFDDLIPSMTPTPTPSATSTQSAGAFGDLIPQNQQQFSLTPEQMRLAQMYGVGAGGMTSIPQNQQQAAEAREFMSGIPGAVPTVVSSAVAEPVAGLAGLVTAPASYLPGIEPGVGARNVERVQEGLTIEPIGEAAQKTLQTTAETLAPVGDLPRRAGEAVQDLGASPGVATAVETGIAAIPEMLGLRGGKQILKARNLAKSQRKLFDQETGLPSPELEKALDKKGMDFGALIGDGDNIPVVFGDKSPDQLVDSIIKRKLEAGDQSEALYKFKIENGRVVNDPLGEEALKQGFKKGDIASVKGANPQTKSEMIKMLRQKRAIQADKSKALDPEFRPTTTVGNSAMERFNFIRDNSLQLRKQLDELAEKRSGGANNRRLEGPGSRQGLQGREINTDSVVQEYLDGLEELEVDIDTSTIPPKLDFSRSLISEDGTSQRVIQSVTNILAKDKSIDARQAHLVKRQLDTMLDFNKKSATGLTDVGETFAKDIRRSINESIREVSPEYARINDQLSQNIEAMKDFDKALGGIDPFADNAPKAVGQILRRLLTEAVSKSALEDSLVSLDDVAKKLGGEFKTDTKRLINFNKVLDEKFGATSRGSMEGILQSRDIADPKQAAKDFIFQKGAEKIKDLQKINEKNAFNVMERILRQ